MTPRCIRTEIDGGWKREQFGVCDNKGREIGAEVYLFEAVYVADDEPESLIWTTRHTKEPGKYYGYVPGSTRARKPYGAGQGRYEFSTVEERDAKVSKYLEGARKRALKNWGKKE